MHQARAVGGDDVLGACPGMIADLVIAHLGGDGLLEDRKSAAKAAAFVRPRRGDELDALDLREQVHWLRVERLVQFGGFCMLQPAQRNAFVVESDAVRELRPRKGVDLLDVVQELDQLKGARPYFLHFRRLLDRIEIVAHMVGTAALRRDDIIEAREITHEESLCVRGLGIEPVIGHRLSATGLVARVYDVMAEALQELEGCNANYREEGIDEAGDEKTNAHPSLLQ